MTRPRCPICSSDTNSFGQPFVSEWAVATHVAGKILFMDRLHRSWAKRRDIEYEKTRSVPQLAEALLSEIHQEIEKDKPLPAKESTPLSFAHDVEVMLHEHIEKVLKVHYGSQENEWWVQGVPLEIRQDCASLRESDPARDECYGYTHLIDLRTILDKKWALFESDFRRIRSAVQSKREFLGLLGQLNDVRNKFSHPIRAPRPNSTAFSHDLGVAQLVMALVTQFCASTI